MWLRFALLLCALGLCFSTGFPAPADENRPTASLSQILNDSTLWGKDFPAALGQLPSWNAIGERVVVVFPSQIQGNTAIQSRDDAARLSGRLSEALNRNSMTRGVRTAFRSEVTTSADDDLLRVVWTDGALEFFSPTLTMAQVMERLGAPEKMSERIIQGRSDRRPLILRLYEYAGGAVAFAESDADPGLVNRVLLSGPAIGDAPIPKGPDRAAPGPPIPGPIGRAHWAESLPAQASLSGTTTQSSTAVVVDIASDETDPRNLADTEPSIAVNPANPLEIAIVTFSERWSPTTMAPVWKSSDGGTTWRKVFQIPQPAPGSSGPGDQKIAYDASGNLFVAELGGGDFIFRQDAGPDDPLTPGARYGNDQPHLDVDKTTTSPCFNKVYSPWLNFGVQPERSTVSFSSDRGDTLTDVAAGDTTAFPNRTSRIAIAPSGKAYLIYKTREGPTSDGFEHAHFRVTRSDDCGGSWQGLGEGGTSVHEPERVETWFTSSWGIAGPGRKVARARSSDAWIATSAVTETIYAVYVRRDESAFGQIYLARSDNEGMTWTSTRVTDGTHHSAYPEVAVADNDTIGVLYVDYEDTGDTTIFRHHFARSFDGGAAWTDEILQSMDPFPIANAGNGFLWGDYEGLTAVHETFYGVFTGASIDRPIAQLDPIFFTETGVPDERTSSTESRPKSR